MKCNNRCIQKCGFSFTEEYQIHRLHRLAYDDLRFNCPNKCGAILTYQTFNKHMANECKEAPKLCPNGSCNKYFTHSNLKKHLRQCPHRIEKCPNCEENVLRMFLDTHIKKECMKRLIKCKLCGDMITASDLESNKHHCIMEARLMIE